MSDEEIAEVLPFKDKKKSRIIANVVRQVRSEIAEREAGGDVLEIIPPTISPVETGEAQRGLKAGQLLKEIVNTEPSNIGRWFESARLAVKNRTAEGISNAITEGRSLGMTTEEVNTAIEALNQNLLAPNPLDPQRIMLGVDEKEGVFKEHMRRALVPAVGERKAQAIVDSGYVTLQGADIISKILTRQQYVRYRSALEGAMKEKVMDEQGAAAWASMQAQLDTSMIDPIPIADGGGVNMTQIPTAQEIPWNQVWLRRIGALQPALEKLQNALGIRFESMNASLSQAHVMYGKALQALTIVNEHYWRQLPSYLRTGLRGTRLAEFSSWLETDEDNKVELAEVVGIKNDINAFARYVQDSMKQTMKVPLPEIIRHAQFIADKKHIFYDWMASQGLVNPVQYRKNYSPIIREYWTEQGEKEVKTPLDEWVWDRKRAKKKKGKVDKILARLDDQQLSQMLRLFDTKYDFQSQGIPIVGQAKQFMEYSRKENEDFMQLTAQVTDTRTKTDIYTRKALRRLMFRNYAPAVARIMQQVNELDLDQRTRKTVDTVMRTYLESILGVPDAFAQALRKVKLDTPVNKMIKVTNEGIKKWNANPLFGKMFQVSELAPSKDFNANDARQMAITFYYMSALGITPWSVNLRSPLKNITSQSPHIVAVLGLPTAIRGWIKAATDKETMKYLKTLDLRPETEYREEVLAGNVRSNWDLIARNMLQLFRMSDLVNVYGAASGGLVAWERLEKLAGTTAERETLTLNELNAALWRGEKDPRMSDKAVMNRGDPSLKMWDGVISRPMSLELLERIKRGEMEEAKKMWLQYVVYATNWKYGPGGTPTWLRHSGVRSMFMYMSWPTNYADFLGSTMVEGTRQAMKGEGSTIFNRWATMYASHLLIFSLLTSMGVAGVHRWFGVSPLPDDLKPVGQLAELLERLLQLLVGAGEYVQGRIIGVEEEALERQAQQIQKNIEDLSPI
jgi:hypothetical protein